MSVSNCIFSESNCLLPTPHQAHRYIRIPALHSTAPPNLASHQQANQAVLAPRRQQTTEKMKPRSCSLGGNGALLLLLLLLCWFCSSVVRSQTTDSCASTTGLSAVSRLIPFDTSNLTCIDAWTSQGFIIRYGKSANGTWSFVLLAPDRGGYVSVGFSRNGAMVGSSAVAGWTNGGVGVAKQYRLGGTSPGSCPPDQGSLALVPGTTLLVSQSSRLYLAFQFAASRPAPYLIYAVGPSGAPLSGNYLVRHRSYASAAVNYATGVASSAGGSSSSNTRKWHGALAGLGWGVLMPVGIVLARYFKQHDLFWFYAHVSVQGVGFVLGAAGVAAGFKLDDDVPGADRHQALGIAVLVFGCLQVMAFLARPDKASKLRRYWNWYHHYVGRAAVVCAVANVFVGLSVAHEAASLGAFYGIFLAVWVVASAVLEIRLWRRRRAA